MKNLILISLFFLACTSQAKMSETSDLIQNTLITGFQTGALSEWFDGREFFSSYDYANVTFDRKMGLGAFTSSTGDQNYTLVLPAVTKDNQLVQIKCPFLVSTVDVGLSTPKYLTRVVLNGHCDVYSLNKDGNRGKLLKKDMMIFMGIQNVSSSI